MNPDLNSKPKDHPTVVLIDNSHAMQAMLRDCLADLQVLLLHYNTVEEADRYLCSNKPNLIFLNLLMPDQNGLTYLRTLRQQALHRETRVVIITSKDYEQDRVAAHDLGASAFLVKPMPMQELIDIVRDVLGEDEATLERTLPI